MYECSSHSVTRGREEEIVEGEEEEAVGVAVCLSLSRLLGSDLLTRMTLHTKNTYMYVHHLHVKHFILPQLPI